MNNQYMRSAHRLAIYRKRASEAKTEYYKIGANAAMV